MPAKSITHHWLARHGRTCPTDAGPSCEIDDINIHEEHESNGWERPCAGYGGRGPMGRLGLQPRPTPRAMVSQSNVHQAGKGSPRQPILRRSYLDHQMWGEGIQCLKNSQQSPLEYPREDQRHMPCLWENWCQVVVRPYYPGRTCRRL